MKNLNLFLVLFSVQLVAQQSEESEQYVVETKSFIKQIMSFKKPKMLLSKPAELSPDPCGSDFLNDTLTFNAVELNQIKESIEKIKVKSWDSAFVPEAKIIDAEEVKKIFEDKKSFGWQIVEKQFGPGGFQQISEPIFLRNFSYCVFYYSQSCGSLCGFGLFGVYKKENGKWKLIKEYCTWVS